MKYKIILFLIFTLLLINHLCGSNSQVTIESKAYNVFERVLAVADKSGKLYPRLEKIVDTDKLVAYADQSGSIWLSKKTIQLCYKDVCQAVGDARLAFLFAHEMTHLARDHFALKKMLPPELYCEKKKNLELDADANALIIIAMAKYNPNFIFDPKHNSFIHIWLDHEYKNAKTANHCYPTPDERLHNLENEIKKVQNTLDLFNTGLRLYQVGMYDDALQFFIKFSNIFPCREVNNNIGLIYYQKAIESLAKYNSQKAYQFMLSTDLDTTTLADIFRQTSVQTKGNDESAYNQFIINLRLARNRFKLANEQDQTYLPAYINLSSVEILNKEFDKASFYLTECHKKCKNQQSHEYYLYANNKALLLYITASKETDSKSRQNQIKQSIDLLKNGINKNTTLSELYYNTGAILFEQGNTKAANEYWSKYILLNPAGIYSLIIKEKLDMRKLTTRQNLPINHPDPEPIQPGSPYNNKTDRSKSICIAN